MFGAGRTTAQPVQPNVRTAPHNFGRASVASRRGLWRASVRPASPARYAPLSSAIALATPRLAAIIAVIVNGSCSIPRVRNFTTGDQPLCAVLGPAGPLWSCSAGAARAAESHPAVRLSVVSALGGTPRCAPPSTKKICSASASYPLGSKKPRSVRSSSECKGDENRFLPLRCPPRSPFPPPSLAVEYSAGTRPSIPVKGHFVQSKKEIPS